MSSTLINWSWSNGGISGDLADASFPTRIQTARVSKIIKGPGWGIQTVDGRNYALVDPLSEQHMETLIRMSENPKLS